MSRNLHELGQAELEWILYADAVDKSHPALRCRFSDEEILQFLDHPRFAAFTDEFRELIWEAVSMIFQEEIAKAIA